MQRNESRPSENRTLVVKKNALLSVVYRTLAMLISLLLVPISIKFVNAEQFGIWLTISSVVAWFSLFDIGLSNGLRNKLVVALSQKNIEAAKTYVSTTYVMLAVIFVTLWLLFMGVNNFIDWTSILKISAENGTSVKTVVLIVFSYFCISFLLKTINSILLAHQKAAFSSLIDLLGQAIALVIIYLMTIYLSGSLLYLSLALCIAPLIVLLIFNLVLFGGQFKYISPSIKYFKTSCVRDLMGLSAKFFVIQIAAIIQYQTANLVIARYFNMAEVTNYNIAFKYFSVLNIVFSMLLLPLWSAATDAYNRQDFDWIRQTATKYLKILFLLILGGIFMLFVSAYVYDLWLGKGVVSIPFVLSLWCFIYMCVTMFGAIYVNILNGIGAVRIQYISSMITPFLYLGLCILFISNIHMGIYAVFVAAIISNINGFIIAPIQLWKIVVQKKKGIWIA